MSWKTFEENVCSRLKNNSVSSTLFFLRRDSRSKQFLALYERLLKEHEKIDLWSELKIDSIVEYIYYSRLKGIPYTVFMKDFSDHLNVFFT